MRKASGSTTLGSETHGRRLAGSASAAAGLTLALLFGSQSCASPAPVTNSSVDPANPRAKPEAGAIEPANLLPHCPEDRADCDGNADNACEALLDRDAQNCGACGVRCAGANGEGACFAGTCRMISCIPGHCDLDGDPKNGCEARTKGCHVNKD